MQQLFRAWEAAIANRRVGGGQLRQAQSILTYDGNRFAPANRLLSFLEGIAFDDEAPSPRAPAHLQARLLWTGHAPFATGDTLSERLLKALAALMTAQRTL